MENNSIFLTVTQINEYAGFEAFRPGMRLRLRKDHDNPYDDEAIACFGCGGGKYGYVANSVRTVIRGTHSAGWLQHLFAEEAECTVRFVAEESAIAELDIPASDLPAGDIPF